MEANFLNSFTDIHQSKLSIVYTRDARNRDLCRQWKWAGSHKTRRTDSSRLNQKRCAWSLVTVFAGTIVGLTCFTDRAVCRTTRMWIQVMIFRRLIFMNPA